VYDVADALGRELGLGGVLHGRVEDAQELSERGLVHEVHQGHLHDQEVQDAAPGGHRTVLLPRLVNLHFRVCRDG